MIDLTLIDFSHVLRHRREVWDTGLLLKASGN